MENYFIITAGPTGSGKTKLIETTLHTIAVETPYEYTKFLIDDLIENDENYKNDVDIIIDSINKKCADEEQYDNCIKEAFDNPTLDLFRQFETAYLKARKEGCNDTGGCNHYLDDMLEKIKKKPPRIAVFETTGLNIPNWLLNPTYIPDEYRVIFSYSLVNIPNLVERNKSRAYSGYLNYISDKTQNHAFRLPNVNEEKITDLVTSIKTKLKTLYENCIKTNNEIVCGEKKIDRLLIFDNNGKKHKLVFDSYIDIIDDYEFEKIIDASINRKIVVKSKSRRNGKKGKKMGKRKKTVKK